MPNEHVPESHREPAGHANGSQIISQIVSLLEKLKDLYPPIEVPPHHPGWDAPHFGGEGGNVHEQLAAAAAARAAAQAKARREQAEVNARRSREAMSEDIRGLAYLVSPDEIDSVCYKCGEAVNQAAPVHGDPAFGPKMGEFLRNPDCRKCVKDSLEYIGEQYARKKEEQQEHERAERAREYLRAIDKSNDEAERYEAESRTA
jgi:hypothetical protein